MGKKSIIVTVAALLLFIIAPQPVSAQRGGRGAPQGPMGFFITSTGPGDGANARR